VYETLVGTGNEAKVLSALRGARDKGGKFSTYTKEEMLERWRYKHCGRTPPILLCADVGYLFLAEDRYYTSWYLYTLALNYYLQFFCRVPPWNYAIRFDKKYISEPDQIWSDLIKSDWAFDQIWSGHFFKLKTTKIIKLAHKLVYLCEISVCSNKKYQCQKVLVTKNMMPVTGIELGISHLWV
jgi:hypothetical protein